MARTMDVTDLMAQLAQGEDSTQQFKADVRNAESLGQEMAAFSDSLGEPC